MTDTNYALICLLGTGSYRECRYALDGHVSGPGRFAPLLEIELLTAQGLTCNALHVLLTAEAADVHEKALNEALETEHPGLNTFFHRIPKGSDRGEIDEVYQTVVDLVQGLPETEAIVADVTHGFRSLSLVMVSALRFAVMEPERTISAILYGAYEARDANDVAPIFDLTALITLDAWAAATRDFDRSHDTAGLASLIGQRRKEIGAQAKDVTNLEHLGHFLRSGLPLEAGIAADRIVRSGLAVRIQKLAPPAATVSSRLSDALDRVTLPSTVSQKGNIRLTAAELRRQEGLIDSAVAQGDLGRALRLAREYLVNRVFESHELTDKWLVEYRRNKVAEALRSSAKPTKLRQAYGDAWEAIVAIMKDRNVLAHCGYSKANVNPTEAMDDFKTGWNLIRGLPNSFFEVILVPQ